MDREIYYVEALVLGLGWLCGGYTQDPAAVERLEAELRDQPARLYPGRPPRRTRIRRKSAAGMEVVRERQGTKGIQAA